METELFVHFAEIAGIFVGFGALISVRSAQGSDLHDVVYLTAVLALGVWVVISALVPITVSRYGVRDHALWLSSALAAIALWVVSLIALWRRPSFRLVNTSPEPLDRFFPLVGLPLHLTIAVSLILIILGVWRRVDEALYVTALAAAVVFAGYTLLTLVMSHNDESEPDRASR